MFSSKISKALPLLGLLALLTLTVNPSTASAHEFILKPAKATVAKGEKIRVEAQASHVFMVSEEAENPAEVHLELRQGTHKLPISLSEDKAANTLAGEVTLPADGTALLVGHRAPQLWSITTEGLLQGDRAALKAQGKKVMEVAKYEKFSKTLLNPAATDTVHKEPVGHALELVLLTNPADLKAGEEFKVLALLRGKPMLQAKVGVSYDGYSTKGDDYVAEVHTGPDGIATFTAVKPGLWMVRTVHFENVTDGSADKQELRSVYVFPVK